jgi:hypothetical protein
MGWISTWTSSPQEGPSDKFPFALTGLKLSMQFMFQVITDPLFQPIPSAR